MGDAIVVTGMGIVTGIGVGVESTLDSLMHCRSGVGAVRYLSTAHTDIPVCEVPMTEGEMRQRLGIPADVVTTRTPLLSLIAMREALQQSHLQPDGGRVALINGTTVGGMEKSEQLYLAFFDDKDVAYISAHDCGAGTAFAADFFGRFSQTTTISTACSSASNAIILGANLIKSGRADKAVVGGTECLSKFHLNGFNTLMILDRERCRPFDDGRNGLNLGEGAAFLVIERESDAKSRGAKILCTLEGYANSCDAFHQTATSPEGEGAYLAMTQALADSGLQPSDIDYINAHGTGTQNNDSSEGNAILRVFGNNYPPISSTKAFTGHCTSAAGSVEAVISILAMQHGFIPPSLGFETPMADVPVVPQKTLKTGVSLTHVMTNSFGFGGNDSSLIFGKYQPEKQILATSAYDEKRRVFIGAASQISVQQPLGEEWFENPIFYNEKYVRALSPDYKQFIDPKAARRMGAVLKRALTTALSALKDRDVADLQAVITGTGLGCIENTEKFLRAMVVDGEQLLTPTYFMQSTHNTISSQVALNLHCHGYNCTYSQRGVSFESALQDAFLQFKLGKLGNALVGGHDEMTPDYYDLLDKVRFWDGTFAGETAAWLYLENGRKSDTWCELLDTQLFFRPSEGDLHNAIDAILQRHGLQRSDIAAVMTGKDENAENNRPYDDFCRLLPQVTVLRYKHLFGEGFTMPAMGIYAAAVCLKNGRIPSFLIENKGQVIDNPQNILIVNCFKNAEYSLTLLSK